MKYINIATRLRSLVKCKYGVNYNFRGLSTDTDTKDRSSSPLYGIKVLDLTRVLAGPYCTMLLGDLGADVIKVERPKIGDDTRSWGPPFLQHKDSTTKLESSYFLSVNRNKRSITIDFQTETGKEIIYDLVKWADVLVENFLPGKLDSLGLGYKKLKSINQKLIYASITGYGCTGPYSSKPGYDVMVEAEAGLMYITGEPDRPPVKVGVAITDLTTGLYCQNAILASLIKRSVTGEGQHIDACLLDCQVASLANLASSYLTAGSVTKRQGTAHASIVPYQAFQTKPNSDGESKSIIVGAGSDRQFQILCKQVLNRTDLLDDEAYVKKFATNALRVQNRKELIDLLQKEFQKEGLTYWLARFKDKGIPYAPINDIKDTFQHEQVQFRDMIRTVEHPKLGNINLVGPAVKYSNYKADIYLPPPTLGQHTDQILTDVLNYDNTKLMSLKKDGVV